VHIVGEQASKLVHIGQLVMNLNGTVRDLVSNVFNYPTLAEKPLLSSISVPTLLLNARNDPFMPTAVLPHSNEVACSVTLELPHEGGHVGFVTGRFPGQLSWLPQRLLHYFDAGV